MLHFPELSAVAVNVSFSLPPFVIEGRAIFTLSADFLFKNLTVTVSPASAVPHTLTVCSRCNTIPSEIRAGNFTFASAIEIEQKQSNTATLTLNLI